MSFKRTCAATPTFLTPSQLRSPLMTTMATTNVSKYCLDVTMTGSNNTHQNNEQVTNDLVSDTFGCRPISDSSSQRLRDEYSQLKLDNDAIIRRIKQDGLLSAERPSKTSSVARRSSVGLPQNTSEACSCTLQKLDDLDRQNQYPLITVSSEQHHMDHTYQKQDRKSCQSSKDGYSVKLRTQYEASGVDFTNHSTDDDVSFSSVTSIPLSERQCCDAPSTTASEHQILRMSINLERELENRKRERDSLTRRLSQFVISNGELQNSLHTARWREDDLIQQLAAEKLETGRLRSEIEMLEQDLDTALRTGNELKAQLATQPPSQTCFSTDEYTSSVKEELRQTTLLALEQQEQLGKLQKTIVSQNHAIKKLAGQIEWQKKEENVEGRKSSALVTVASSEDDCLQTTREAATPLADEVFMPINQFSDEHSKPISTPIERLQIANSQNVSIVTESSPAHTSDLLIRYPPSASVSNNSRQRHDHICNMVEEVSNNIDGANLILDELQILQNGPVAKPSQSVTIPTSSQQFARVQEQNSIEMQLVKECPMCNTLFDSRIPQDEFERHVYSHF